MTIQDQGVAVLHELFEGAIRDIEAPRWKFWKTPSKRRAIIDLIDQSAPAKEVWIDKGIALQCVCGLADATRGPGRRYAVKALSRIGPATIRDLVEALPEDDTGCRRKLDTALKALQ